VIKKKCVRIGPYSRGFVIPKHLIKENREYEIKIFVKKNYIEIK